MKISMMCWTCFTETEDLSDGPLTYHGFVVVGNDGACQMKCPKGHETTMVLTQQNFEVLLALGTYAIVDGYYREAVSSFTSSLERFYEYYTKVIAIKHGVPIPNIGAAWKNVKRQSERQLGSFIFSYLLENKTAPPLLSDERVKFRNNVIHNGLIPSRTEAETYGEVVLQLIRPVFLQLYANSVDAMGEFYVANATNINTTLGKSIGSPTLIMSNSGLSALYPSFDGRFNTLQDEIESVAQIRQWQLQYPHGYWTRGKVMVDAEPAEAF